MKTAKILSIILAVVMLIGTLAVGTFSADAPVYSDVTKVCGATATSCTFPKTVL